MKHESQFDNDLEDGDEYTCEYCGECCEVGWRHICCTDDLELTAEDKESEKADTLKYGNKITRKQALTLSNSILLTAEYERLDDRNYNFYNTESEGIDG